MKNKDYKIKFTSLKDGLHTFTFNIRDEFFEQFEYTDIKGAKVIVEIELEKQQTMMIANFSLTGTVKIMCDRCTDNVDLPIKSDDEIIYKFTETEFDDEKVISVYHNEIEIDIMQPIYEFISLSIPSKRLHKKGECNQIMLEEINKYLLVEKDEQTSSESITNNTNNIDPRWSQLNNLKFKK
ncbi:MAG TPA: DUF177 domain-containing protein [Crocinitomix sp.]|nr:DUF177 domain-containing protein [Crocinitomix sp.]